MSDRHEDRKESFSVFRLLAVLVVFAFLIALFAIISTKPSHPPGSYCGASLSGLGKAMYVYANDFAGKLPPADKWCDLLVEQADVLPRRFLCRAVDAGKGQGCYAMNKNVSGKKLFTLAGDVVLLFETRPGWNQYGGPELLTLENHQSEGCNVLFADGRVEFVKADRIGQLKWEIEDEPKSEAEDVQPRSNEEPRTGKDRDDQ